LLMIINCRKRNRCQSKGNKKAAETSDPQSDN
jgi:hypothetical protein